jgi:hypothetical protein
MAHIIAKDQPKNKPRTKSLDNQKRKQVLSESNHPMRQPIKKRKNVNKISRINAS